MYYTVKLLFLSIIYFHTLYAEEIFVNQDKLKLSHITHSDIYCKMIKPEHQLCKSKKLTYIDYQESDLPSFMRGLENYTKPIVKSYNDDNLLAKHSFCHKKCSK